MACQHDEKIILDILREIIEKSDGKHVVELDLSDENKAFNFDLLQKEKKNFSYFTKTITNGSDGSDGGVAFYSSRTQKLGLKGLTLEGHQLFTLLKNKLDSQHREIEAVTIAKESNLIAERSNEISVRSARWAYVAVFIAILSLLWQIVGHIVHVIADINVLKYYDAFSDSEKLETLFNIECRHHPNREKVDKDLCEILRVYARMCHKKDLDSIEILDYLESRIGQGCFAREPDGRLYVTPSGKRNMDSCQKLISHSPLHERTFGAKKD